MRLRTKSTPEPAERMSQPLVRPALLFTMAAVAALSLPSSTAAQTVYDFSTGAGVDRFAYGDSITSSPIPPTSNTIPASQIPSPIYPSIAASDSSVYSTGTFSGSLRAAMRYVFSVVEPRSTITDLEMLWEGRGTSGGVMPNDIDVWAWNATTAVYTLVGSTQQGSTPDAVISKLYTTDAQDYVDGSNQVTMLVTNSTSDKGILVDYVKITVTGFICQNDGECDDANVCTDDVCNVGVCEHTNNTDPCDDGLFCTATDVCSDGSCVGSGDACPGQICDEDGDVCVDCIVDGDCDDDVGCTDDTCVTESCVFTPIDANCLDDGAYCNGLEVCDPALDCISTGDPCQPTEMCNEATDSCDECLIDGDCDDGIPCTDDTCVSGVCQYTPAGEIAVDVQIEGLDHAVDRDVTFVVTTCGGSVDTRVETVAFAADGVGAIGLTGVDTDATWISAAEGHTLRRVEPLSFVSCTATVDWTGANALRSGDFHTGAVSKDQVVDVTDFSILAANFNLPIDPNLSTGADATGNGVQGTEDFTAIQVNFFNVGNPVDGCPASAEDQGLTRSGDGSSEHLRAKRAPMAEIAVELLPLDNAQEADLNGDGVVNTHDIRAFARAHGLSLEPQFVRRLKMLETGH